MKQALVRDEGTGFRAKKKISLWWKSGKVGNMV